MSATLYQVVQVSIKGDNRLMDSRSKKQRLVSTLLLCLLIASLIGCSPPFPTGHKITPPDPGITPIVSIYQPARLVSVLIDTPPYFEASYFNAVLNAIADRVLELTTLCQGGLTVFASFLGHDSVHTKVISITVQPLPCDPPIPMVSPTPDPAKYQNPYDYADAVAKVKKANAEIIDTWQVQLRSNHHLLASVHAEVKKAAEALRAQPVIFDNTGADIYGGLFLASQEFQNSSKAVKTLVIASPLINNTSVNASSTIKLAGVSAVNVIYHSCETMTASVCSANDARWRQTLLNFGVKIVNFYTPPQSVAWHITF